MKYYKFFLKNKKIWPMLKTETEPRNRGFYGLKV